MTGKILNEIYDTIIYPSEKLQKLILIAEEKMKENSKSIGISDSDKEVLWDIFVDSEQEIRKALFLTGFRLGLDVMVDYLKNDVTEL